MKKFAKVCSIMAGILAALGIVLCFISAAIGGGNTALYWKERVRSYAEGTKGIGMHTEQIPMEQIKNLTLTLGAGEFVIVEKDEADGQAELAITGSGNCSYGTERGTLHIKGFQNTKFGNWWRSNRGNHIVLEIPKGFCFEEVTVELGAGVMTVENLCAREAELEIGAGELTIQQGNVQELHAQAGAGQIRMQKMNICDGELSVDMGECIYEGSISGNLEAECDMGNLNMELAGREQNYNYELECDMGNITVGSESIKGISSEKTIDNGALGTFEVSCGMGNIIISFTEKG